MNAQPVKKIAVLVPAYNVEKYLGACLDSLLAQTRPVDIFCCDDGSTDNTFDILKKYAARYLQIHMLHHENRGMVATYNRLMDELPQEYDAFGFVDADDFVSPDMYHELACAIEKTAADVAECGVVRVASDAGVAALNDDKRCETTSQVINDMSIYMLRSTSPGAWINKWNKLYRRQSVAGIRIRTGLNHEDDYYYACEVNACIRRKVIVGRALYAYRRNPESVISALNHERYFLACCERIRLSQVEFLNAGRIPPHLAHSFRCELANDAYRMCIRKNLKKNKRRVQN